MKLTQLDRYLPQKIRTYIEQNYYARGTLTLGILNAEHATSVGRAPQRAPFRHIYRMLALEDETII